MTVLRVSLLGKLEVRVDEQAPLALESRKAQELFVYLLLHRERDHARETLAGLLWGDHPTSRSRNYLRKALWQLQTVLETRREKVQPCLLVDPEWIRLNPERAFWLDVAAFEQAFHRFRGRPGRALDSSQVSALRAAADLYRGDLLEGWYQDWALYQRERFQQMFLDMLDRLMDFCEAHNDYEAGLAYGQRALRYDRARESTHCRMMRLLFFAGDRTAALRQYDRCSVALREELEADPDQHTSRLYELIRADQMGSPALDLSPANRVPVATSALLPEVLERLRQFQAVLDGFHGQVQQAIQTVELALNSRN